MGNTTLTDKQRAGLFCGVEGYFDTEYALAYNESRPPFLEVTLLVKRKDGKQFRIDQTFDDYALAKAYEPDLMIEAAFNAKLKEIADAGR